MANYDDAQGSKGAVENNPYCMPSWNARNTKSMNQQMGYNNMSDRANSRCPTTMKGAKVNKQVMK